jgi:hypothetical protein
MAAYLLFATLAQGKADDLARLPQPGIHGAGGRHDARRGGVEPAPVIPVRRAGIRLRPDLDLSRWGRSTRERARRGRPTCPGRATDCRAGDLVGVPAPWWHGHAERLHLRAGRLPAAVCRAGGSHRHGGLSGLATGSERAHGDVSEGGLRTGGSARVREQETLARGPDHASLERAQRTLAASARAIIVATCAGAAVLFAIASAHRRCSSVLWTPVGTVPPAKRRWRPCLAP